MDAVTVALDAAQMQELIASIETLQNLVSAIGYSIMACAGMVIFAFLSYGFWRYIFGRNDG